MKKYSVLFLPILFMTACFTPRGEKEISNSPLRDVSYYLHIDYPHEASTAVVDFGMSIDENDSVKNIRAGANDTIRIGKHVFEYNDGSYKATIPVKELAPGFSLYVKLKDTICFSGNRFTLPYYDNLSVYLDDSFRVEYSPALTSADEMRYCIYNGKHKVNFIYDLNGLKSIISHHQYHPGAQQFATQVVLPRDVTYYERKGIHAKFTLTKTQSGSYNAEYSLSLRYRFECSYHTSLQTTTDDYLHSSEPGKVYYIHDTTALP